MYCVVFFFTRGMESVDVITNEPALATAALPKVLDEEEIRYAPGPKVIEMGVVEVGEKEFKLTPMAFDEGDTVDEEDIVTPFKTDVL